MGLSFIFLGLPRECYLPCLTKRFQAETISEDYEDEEYSCLMEQGDGKGNFL